MRMPMPTLLITLAILLLIVIGLQKFYLLRPKIELTGELIARLQELAKRSLETLDVPVAALLLYKKEIIGEGFNTVFRNGKAGEHAEINAISSAIGSVGMEKFLALDRSQLVLISTFEPCLMCSGAFVSYNIRTVYFMEEKDAAYLLKEARLLARYMFRRTLVRNRGEQVALFKLHPHYPGRSDPS